MNNIIKVETLINEFIDMEKRGTLLCGKNVSSEDLLSQIIGTIVKTSMKTDDLTNIEEPKKDGNMKPIDFTDICLLEYDGDIKINDTVVVTEAITPFYPNDVKISHPVCGWTYTVLSTIKLEKVGNLVGGIPVNYNYDMHDSTPLILTDREFLWFLESTVTKVNNTNK